LSQRYLNLQKAAALLHLVSALSTHQVVNLVLNAAHEGHVFQSAPLLVAAAFQHLAQLLLAAVDFLEDLKDLIHVPPVLVRNLLQLPVQPPKNPELVVHPGNISPLGPLEHGNRHNFQVQLLLEPVFVIVYNIDVLRQVRLVSLSLKKVGHGTDRRKAAFAEQRAYLLCD
jgi:hypothetical protein